MSEYVFLCLDCNREFSEHLHMSEFDEHKVECPHCGSHRVTQRVEAFSAVTGKKS